MLSIGKMVARAEDYYLRTVASGREEYYTGSGEAPGYWLGEGARRLGLQGQVAPCDLRGVLAGIGPQGQSLNAGRVDPAKRVAGFDLTFSAPKSVSLLYGLSTPAVSTIVRSAHGDAVAQALGYLERHALRLRRGAGGERGIGAHGVVAGAFVHRTSRAGDPQLHTHVLVANVAEGLDGEWSAPDARLLYFHARTAGFLYQAALRSGLRDVLGLRFGSVNNGMAEVEGTPKTLLRAFSTRRRQIEDRLNVTGSSSAHAAEAAALASRSAKDFAHAISADGLFERWRAQAAELGNGVSRSGRLLLRDLQNGDRRGALTQGAVVAHLLGPDGLTAGESSFERRDVVRQAAALATSGARVGEVEAIADAVLANRFVLALGTIGRGGEARFTTSEVLELEAELIQGATARKNVGAAVVAESHVIAALARYPLLAREQTAMVRRLSGSGDGVEAVVGPAGTGKTLALAAANEAWMLSGSRVIGAALSARAARGLAEGSGIESGTLAKLLDDLGSRELELRADDVVVVDEAGMVGTRHLAQLVEATTRARAKLVLVGDPRQLPEIESGGAFAGLIERLGATELRTNRRQEHAWERRALGQLRIGRAASALVTYDLAGRVHMADSIGTTREMMVAAWISSRERGENSVMLALSRRDVAELNALARSALRQRAELGSDVIEVDGVGFALGDEAVCLRNSRRLGVVNGTVGSVVDVEGAALVLRTSDGDRRLPTGYVANGHLGHAYALTIHKAQGATVDRAYVLATESLTRESGYVAMSRARLGTEVFMAKNLPDGLGHDPRQSERDPIGALAQRLTTSRAKRLASDERVASGSLEISAHECEEGEVGMSNAVRRDDRSPTDGSVDGGDDFSAEALGRMRLPWMSDHPRGRDRGSEPERSWGLER